MAWRRPVTGVLSVVDLSELNKPQDAPFVSGHQKLIDCQHPIHQGSRQVLFEVPGEIGRGHGGSKRLGIRFPRESSEFIGVVVRGRSDFDHGRLALGDRERAS
jgi:hypothetical protein